VNNGSGHTPGGTGHHHHGGGVGDHFLSPRL